MTGTVPPAIARRAAGRAQHGPAMARRAASAALRALALTLALTLALGLAACGTAPRAPVPAHTVALDAALEQRLLRIDPDDVSDADVREVLAKGPTPRIVNLHGGIYPVHLVMESFARFLVGMGYPEARIRHPGDGRRSHSPYESSLQLAGTIAWYYENEGLMPMMVGHSQGGIQLVKVLHLLAGRTATEIAVWNPISDSAEPRTTVVDPYTGRERPVVGLKIGYAAVVGAGGAALLLPNQWDMVGGRLQAIPDSVDEFTGFALDVDLIAWDLPGNGAAYRPLGSAQVRNVRLPAEYSHVFVASTSHLARDPAVRDWINHYRPGSTAPLPAAKGSLDNLLFAAEVWHGLKKHWVLEAQRAMRARRLLQATAPPP